MLSHPDPISESSGTCAQTSPSLSPGIPNPTIPFNPGPSEYPASVQWTSLEGSNISGHLDQKETATYWLAAEHARQHAESCKSQIAAVFNRHGIQKHQYIIFTGFDEYLVKNSGGYLEQIHIITSADLGDMSLLPDLGMIFSPYSAILFTPSTAHEIPVYKTDGSMWQWDELVYHTAKQFNIDRLQGDPQCSTTIDSGTHPPIIGLSHSSSGSTSSDGSPTVNENNTGGASTNEKGNGKKKADISEGDGTQDDATDTDDSESNPESDPESNPESNPKSRGEGNVVINIVSEIYSNDQQMKERKEGDFQKLSMRGAFSVKASNKESKMPSVDVKFADLRFGSKRNAGNTGYNQYHLRVEVASGAQTADITGILPRRTSAFDRAIKDSSSTKTIKSGGFNFSCGMKGIEPSGTVGMNGTTSSERSHGLERTRFLDQIAETSSDGSTCWDFTIDDPSAQEYGIHLPDDRLPSVNFRFPATPLPSRLSVAIASFWSLVTSKGQSQSWISKLFHREVSHETKDMPVYSNLCQVVIVGVSPRIKGEHQHKTKMYVNSGNAAMDYYSRTECISPPTSDVDSIPTLQTLDPITTAALDGFVAGEDGNLTERKAFWNSPNTVQWFKQHGHTLYQSPSEVACTKPEYPNTYYNLSNTESPGDHCLYLSQGKVAFAQNSLNVHVAIKIVRAETDEYRILQFLSQQKLETLKENCIIPVLDVFPVEGFWFAVMPRPSL
ncbi:hypothetical protein CVT25_007157 [Psilocybe cyanescens]|uniref:Protein kinase domain-containing protein n=1 Tax=Psilocybe cyanescens TaxID=93625 RepID=A0A409WVK1_PSICY|nr:hypothetical protein CVT25_007157 [Psilocybe cyanescens]